MNPLAPALEALGRGDARNATLLLKHVLAREPGHGEAWLTLAAPLVAQGQPKPALLLVERALAIDPTSPLGQRNAIALANASGGKQRLLALLSRALANTDNLELRLLRAETARSLNLTSAAKAEYQKILDDHPGHLVASVNFAAAQSAAGSPRDAISALRRAIALAPQVEPAWTNLSYALLLTGAADASLKAAGIAGSIDPASVAAQMNIASARDSLDAIGVERALRRAIALGPGSTEALQALARQFSRSRQWDEFDNRIMRARALAPEDSSTALALAQGHLVRGHLRNGWRYWEGRLSRLAFNHSGLQGRRWSGQPLDGETILVYAEQGFGEALQFIRFVPDVAAKAASVVLEVPSELLSLITRSLPEIDVIHPHATKPPHAWHCAVPSLASVLGIELRDLPGRIPYLTADPGGVAQWRQRLDHMAPLRVGLCWRGNPSFPDDRRRSPGLGNLRQLLGADATFVSLTKAPTTDERPLLRRIHDVTAQLVSFDDTASLVSALDLVITSDTAIAHLAGGLGMPVWLMLAHAADWRWLIDRHDSPWYPTMRIFRQPRPGDWASVEAAIVDDLRLWTHSGDLA